ncbi:hypothetical protein [Bacillus sp. PDNC022]|uniref:hypothetical protein n=1 Tax=Bacillus sp. PDNC022 TaxID=2812759 RepID=UPI001965C8BC|nr:hypothetical protein [Bacillus sp. PDNC022]QRY38431.1 hypothetical protein JVX94_05555 [Bacillus sp. PDNC022]
MKLDFENWISSQALPKESLPLIEEAISCYRIGAYRASFILSYSFFLKILKHRLETSASQQIKPDLIKEDTWRTTIMKLNNDDTWEDIVFTTIQASDRDTKRSSYYLINDGIREDMRYWRRRRNDCAHAKNNLISNSTVESFWHFIESNSAKFVINGGEEGLINKIKTHFDPNYTQPGKSSTYLADQIPLVVESYSEIPDLLEKIYNMLIIEFNGDLKFKNEESPIRIFWKEIAFSNNVDLMGGFLSFVKRDWETFIEFISVFPSKLNEFTSDEPLIRNFWKEQFFKYKDYRENFWNIALILINNAIPNSESSSFMKKLVKEAPTRYINEDNLHDIKRINYFGYMKDYLFGQNNFIAPNGYNNANMLSEKILIYLKHGVINAEIVKEINSLVSELAFGNFYDDFKHFLKKNNDIMFKFKQIADTEELTLSSFFNDFIEADSDSSI